MLVYSISVTSAFKPLHSVVVPTYIIFVKFFFNDLLYTDRRIWLSFQDDWQDISLGNEGERIKSICSDMKSWISDVVFIVWSFHVFPHLNVYSEIRKILLSCLSTLNLWWIFTSIAQNENNLKCNSRNKHSTFPANLCKSIFRFNWSDYSVKNPIGKLYLTFVWNL